MYLDNETDELLDILKSSEKLNNINFIKACPRQKADKAFEKGVYAGTCRIGFGKCQC